MYDRKVEVSPGEDANTLRYIAKFILVSSYTAPAPTTAHHSNDFDVWSA
jgi:hypothetical protein